MTTLEFNKGREEGYWNVRLRQTEELRLKLLTAVWCAKKSDYWQGYVQGYKDFNKQKAVADVRE